jgi:hypothetical protein
MAKIERWIEMTEFICGSHMESIASWMRTLYPDAA